MAPHAPAQIRGADARRYRLFVDPKTAIPRRAARAPRCRSCLWPVAAVHAGRRARRRLFDRRGAAVTRVLRMFQRRHTSGCDPSPRPLHLLLLLLSFLLRLWRMRLLPLPAMLLLLLLLLLPMLLMRYGEHRCGGLCSVDGSPVDHLRRTTARV